ncbi:hypothetical protein BS47DRAFT_1369944 [Hydnum rufescens UP504]|uniref:Uncharacterized protein n=1 Tax=Hydnum rufescens UP504 TaxID=1448309 RepID=A0A9P6DFK1_9AGAM|nr:hypothetical protein BS47DRAFT_1369944 [Hydnum rufescens UP504]
MTTHPQSRLQVIDQTQQNNNLPNEPPPPEITMVSSKMTTRQNNIRQTKPANDDWPDRTPDKTTPAKAAMTPAKRTTPTTTSQTKPKRAPHTRFCGCVVILSLSSEPNTRDPAKRTRENDNPPTK